MEAVRVQDLRSLGLVSQHPPAHSRQRDHQGAQVCIDVLIHCRRDLMLPILVLIELLSVDVGVDFAIKVSIDKAGESLLNNFFLCNELPAMPRAAAIYPAIG